jgi:predicted ATPase
MKQNKTQETENALKKYVLTGAPGSGKSSIILDLEARGEYIIREAAEDVIKKHQALGNKEPWLNPNFQREILALQLKREARVYQNIKRVFIDRGIPDGLTYAPRESKIAQEIIQNTPRYDAIFLIQNLEKTDTNEIRREDYEEARELERKLTKVYEELGYELIKISPTNLQERTTQILTYIKHDAMTRPEREKSGGKK